MVLDRDFVVLEELQGPRESLGILVNVAEQELIVQCSLETAKPSLVCSTNEHACQVARVRELVASGDVSECGHELAWAQRICEWSAGVHRTCRQLAKIQ